MELAADALVDLPTAQKYVRGSKTTSKDDDLVLTLLVNAYSRAIARYTGREFAPRSPGGQSEGTLARTFAYDASGFLSLKPYEARDITAVKIDDETTDLPTTDYTLQPRNKTTESTYLWLDLPKRGSKVTVTGKWGVGDAASTAIPNDVVLACLIAVADAFRNPESFATRSLGELTFTEEVGAPADGGGSLPLGARRLLYPYRRR